MEAARGRTAQAACFLALAVLLACMSFQAAAMGEARVQEVFDLDGREVRVEARVEPPIIPFHERARLVVEIDAPAKARIEPPRVVSPEDATVEPEEEGAAKERVTGNRRLVVFEYAVDAVWPDRYELGPITSVARTLQEERVLAMEGPALQVRDLTPAEEEALQRFARNAAPVDPQPLWRRIAPYAAGAALAVLAAAAAWLLLRRRGEGRQTAQTPWDAALARLRALETAREAEATSANAYYVEVADILRTYLEQRFDLNAPEQSTPELLTELSRGGPASPEQAKTIERVLRQCDRVKFAQYAPAAEADRRIVETVRRFVETSLPPPSDDAEAPEYVEAGR